MRNYFAPCKNLSLKFILSTWRLPNSGQLFLIIINIYKSEENYRLFISWLSLVAIIELLRPLGRKTVALYWGLESTVVCWLSLIIYVTITPIYGCYFSFTNEFNVLFFSSFVSYNLLFLNRETNIWRITVCTLFYPLFHSRVTSNSAALLFHVKVVSNSISPCSPLLYFGVMSNSFPSYSW